MRFKWTSITESEFERYVERCNFTDTKLRILELRCKGATPVEVAKKTKYSEAQMYRISAEVVLKINKEMRV